MAHPKLAEPLLLASSAAFLIRRRIA